LHASARWARQSEKEALVKKIYSPPFKPREKQSVGFLKMRQGNAQGPSMRNFALLMAMRVGKTKLSLDDFGQIELDGEARDFFLLAPGGVYREWEAAIKEHISADLKGRMILNLWESGPSSGERKARDKFLNTTDRPRFFLMNIEALSSVAEAREAAVRFLKEGKTYFNIDESTIIKNQGSKRTKFVNTKLSDMAAFRRIMSGLPTPRSPMDLYSQFEFLDWRILGFKSFFAFRNRYAIIERVNFGGRSNVPIIKGYRDIDSLYEKIEPHSYRVLLEDCYDLPPKLWTFRDVEMTAEQKRIYKEMKTFATAQIAEQSYVTATIVIAQIMRLHQIVCGFTKDEDGCTHEIPENRTSSLIDLLNDYDGKAIIWASYDYSIHKVHAAIEKEFGAGSCARFWGGNVKTREAEERRFKCDPGCRFMLATPDAGGRGREWSVAKLVVYYSSKNNLEHRNQSEERAQAVGKTDSVLYVDMRCKGTVEEPIIAALREKIDMASAINGDSYREWLI
jgi:hypothetical protein